MRSSEVLLERERCSLSPSRGKSPLIGKPVTCEENGRIWRSLRETDIWRNSSRQMCQETLKKCGSDSVLTAKGADEKGVGTSRHVSASYLCTLQERLPLPHGPFQPQQSMSTKDSHHATAQFRSLLRLKVGICCQRYYIFKVYWYPRGKKWGILVSHYPPWPGLNIPCKKYRNTSATYSRLICCGFRTNCRDNIRPNDKERRMVNFKLGKEITRVEYSICHQRGTKR